MDQVARSRPRSFVPSLNSVAAVIVSIAFGVVGYVGGRPAVHAVQQAWVDRRANATLAEKWDAMVASGSALGPESGLPIVVEFSDYECPFCRAADAVLDSILPRTGVRVLYHHLPIRELHPRAEGAAKAAICAERQGRFQAMHHVLMTTTGWQSDMTWTGVALAAAVPDTAAFASCLDDPRTLDRLARDSVFAKSLGVNGTPSFFGQHDIHRGGFAIPDFLAAVKSHVRE